MRLHRLEISGFKSFPDRAELAFDAGVTAIVGPNGCGKSNVVDAITWVLGEQSAKSLRGERMEDVIFSGSDARRPTSAAEVRLHFAGVANALRAAREAQTEVEAEDTDTVGLPEFELARNVQVSRRLYRSGESEYLIDGHVCRLRDVQDLLMDAGLGVKAYAVIEQGKIGQILSAKPTERRQLIEEAAGVTKYKSRRRAAELKLEAAQQNLTRVDDIIFEVEKQRGALKRQAARARRYRRLREELRGWEKIQFARRNGQLQEAIASARARLEVARAREAEAAERLGNVEAALQTLRAELSEAESATNRARQQAHTRELEINRRQQQIEFDRQQVEVLGTTGAQIEAEVGDLTARQEPAERELVERREAMVAAEARRDEAGRAHAAAQQEWQIAQQHIHGVEEDVEAARSEVFAAINTATTLRHAIEQAAAARVRIAGGLAKLDAEQSDLRVEAERVEKDREAALESVRRIQASLEATKTARSDAEARLASTRIEREWRARDVRAREHELASLQGRLRSLEELDAARAGYGDAARYVLAQTDTIKHEGAVADHIEVSRRYERAVEACFGDLLQHVIVQDHEHVEAALDAVRSQNTGRCGFLVAGHAPESRQVADDAPEAELVPVLAVVTPSGPARSAIAHALEGAWIAPTFAQARTAAFKVSGPVATPDGDVFRGPSLVQGGTGDHARGILATKREIKELRDRIDREWHEVRRMTAEVTLLDTAVAQAELDIAARQTEQHAYEKELVALQLHVNRASEETERVARKQELVAVESRSADEELRTLEARERDARSAIAELEGRQREADERFVWAQRRLMDARAVAESLGGRAAETRAGHAGLLERAVALAAEVRRLEDAGEELKRRIAGRNAELGRTAERRNQLREAITAAEEQLAADADALTREQETVREVEARATRLHGNADAQEAEIRRARAALDETRSEASRLDVAQARAEADLAHLAESCMETLQMTLEEVAVEAEQIGPHGIPIALAGSGAEEEQEAAEDEAERSAEPSPERVVAELIEPAPVAAAVATPEEAIAALRAKIDRLGPVNMMAIDQFDELESRYSFLTSQHKDLVDSIAQTGEAIRKIDKTTRERFREAFDAVNAHFQETFTTLFGGGRAGLVMLDDTDVLESGIDIIAQPPGKRLQNVQLLSGGEKALTAMALMFGIFKYRPSPFCLLDEIDAPLDDANIGRFVEMLRGMQHHTQFILITHNRKTMEIADRLYGVTMEEPGVSKLISVRLN